MGLLHSTLRGPGSSPWLSQLSHVIKHDQLGSFRRKSYSWFQSFDGAPDLDRWGSNCCTTDLQLVPSTLNLLYFLVRTRCSKTYCRRESSPAHPADRCSSLHFAACWAPSGQALVNAAGRVFPKDSLGRHVFWERLFAHVPGSTASGNMSW